MDRIVETLLEHGFSARLFSYSALDRFCGLKAAPFVWLETSADLADLSRLFDELRFPGPDIADAAVGSVGDEQEQIYLVRCLGDEDASKPFFNVLEFRWDAVKRSYVDPNASHAMARGLREGPKQGQENPVWFSSRRDADARDRGRPRAAGEAALILSRYPGAGAGDIVPAELLDCLNRLPDTPALSAWEQRILLSGIMTSGRPDLGLRLLQATGFLDGHWPELAAMDDVDHSKEFHPEGNAWDHTLETFKYRKILDLTLSLGLLLHDSGKPLAEAAGGRRFDKHAELGEGAAREFMERLEFPAPLIDDVAFLVRNHMMPAALPRLPLTRTQAALESPLFPLLLELYRCDESSSFKNQGGFYDSCAAYQTYLRNVKNPYRSADGKKNMKKLFSQRG